jgi:hypothetical protein
MFISESEAAPSTVTLVLDAFLKRVGVVCMNKTHATVHCPTCHLSICNRLQAALFPSSAVLCVLAVFYSRLQLLGRLFEAHARWAVVLHARQIWAYNFANAIFVSPHNCCMGTAANSLLLHHCSCVQTLHPSNLGQGWPAMLSSQACHR